MTILKNYKFLSEFRPRPHQEVGMELLLRNKRAYLLHDMGAGKTLTCLWTCDYLIEHKKIDKVLIVAPLSILQVWSNEIIEHIPNRKYVIAHGTRDKRLAALESEASFYITNHDCFRNYEKDLIKAKFDVVIIDELTGFKHNSARTKSAAKVCASAKASWGLTGLPTPASPEDAFWQAKVINPTNLPTPYVTSFRNMTMNFINEYTWVHKPGWEKIVRGTMSPAHRVKLDDCVELPPIVTEQRTIELTADQKKAYKAMMKEQIAEYKSGQIVAGNAATKVGKLLQIICGSAIGDDGKIIRFPMANKLNELLAILQESASGKVVVFCQHVDPVKRIGEFLESKKIKVGVVYGDIPLNERNDRFRRFYKGDGQVLVAQIRTASHGVQLQSCNVAVYFSAIAGNEYYRQSMRRIRRSGQTRRQVVIQLVSGHLEKRMFKKLDDDELNAQSLLDLYKGELG